MDQFAIYTYDTVNLKISYEQNIIIGISFTADEGGVKTPLTDDVFNQFVAYFNGERTVFTFSYEMRGTEFQKKVWQALCEIPYGQTRSYKQIAIAIGNEKASRAVGMANNKNPLAIVVPCHRVIGANGKLVGYAGGVSLKERLLQLETERATRNI